MARSFENIQKFTPTDFDDKPKLSPDELLEIMGRCAYRFEEANRYIKKYFQAHKEWCKRIRVAILGRDFNQIQNLELKLHLETVFENEKYKPTIEDLENFVYLETKELSEQMDLAESIAKQAQKEYEMWYGQLVWYMSLNKLDVAELNTLGVKK